ncbi:sensor histidine kinase [Novosphingobium sp.]|uniref:sensor histidine kinase n=1 Tax=Novosphingobium sp. TaxID=1874826 RepID=UPI0038BCC2B5
MTETMTEKKPESGRRKFNRKSGRVLATSRVLIAVAFLLALALDPTQPARNPHLCYGFLIGYLAWSLLLMAIAWRSWWHDFRLAGIVHVTDIASFLAAVYFTETSNGEFISPFTAFAVFLLINATIRWGWNGIVGTALILLLSNGLAAAFLVAYGYDVDPYRFARRQTYMVLLSIMLTWLGSDRRGRPPLALPEPLGIPGERRVQVMSGALAYARHSIGAGGAAIALVQDEEPWVDVMRDDDGAVIHTRIGPGPLADSLASRDCAATLFDRRRGRAIVARTDTRHETRKGLVEIGLAAHCNVDTGLLVPICSAAGKGVLLLWDIADVCVDDLGEATGLAREIGLALDREEMAALAQSAAVAGVRNALARDLHDSVAQFLAGTQFRLEALRRWLREGRDPDPEIIAMKDALRHEQGQLRAMIERLRLGESGDRGTDLVAELAALTDELGHHWRIITKLDATPGQLVAPIALTYELRQVVREAVANAVRHGGCSQVSVAVTRDERDALRLSISDDGRGFSDECAKMRPRSISERVEALGGRLQICHGHPGARLEIQIPVRLTT